MTKENRYSEEEIFNKKAPQRWYIRLVLAAIKSPVQTALLCMLLYFACKGYVFQIEPITNKMYMVGVLIVGLLWFMAKNILKIILLAGLIAYGFYMYHTVETRELHACETSGGTWNEKTQKCEEKTGFWSSVVDRFSDLEKYISEQDKTNEHTGKR